MSSDKNTLNIGAAPAMQALTMPIEPAQLKTSTKYFVLENFVYAEIELLEIDLKAGPYREPYMKFLLVGDMPPKVYEQPCKRYAIFADEEATMNFLADKCLACIKSLQDRYLVLHPPTSIIPATDIDPAEAAAALGSIHKKKPRR